MSESLEKQIKNDTYQVFLMASPATLPVSFALHPWLVINQKGNISRYGVGRYNSEEGRKFFGSHTCEHCSGHLHKNAKPPSEGLEIYPYSRPRYWNGKILGKVEGGEGSLAQKMTESVSQSTTYYPHRNRYSLLGPNSNTYVQWVLNQFPESGLRLPWNAFGKNSI